MNQIPVAQADNLISENTTPAKSIRQQVADAFFRNFPSTARPEPTILRYVMLRAVRRQRPAARVLSVLSSLISLLGLLAFGYLIAVRTGHLNFSDILNPFDKVYLVLFWPMVIIQAGTRLAALVATTGIAAAEVRRGTWETLRSTTNGSASTLRMHCLAVFYRLRPLLLGLLLIRVLLIISSLINLTAFNGNYLDDMIGGTLPFGTPGVPVILRTAIAVMLIAIGMTASLILPFSALALDSTFGVLFSTFTRSGWLGTLTQTGLLLGRLFISGLALWVGALAIFGSDPVVGLPGLPSPLTLSTNLARLIGAFFGLAEGDWGLTLLHQQHTQILWSDVRYGVLVSVGLLIYALLQIGAAQMFLQWAVRRAERPDPR